MVYLDQAKATADTETQKALVKKILDLHAEHCWTISICTPPPQPVVVHDSMKGVPKNALVGEAYSPRPMPAQRPFG